MDHTFPSYLYSQQPPSQGLTSFGAQQQDHQQDNNIHPTLPPLQQTPQNGGYSFGNLHYNGAHPSDTPSQSHTPATPHTPASSTMSGAATTATFAQMSSPHPQQGSMPPPSSFNQPYMCQGIMYQSSAADPPSATTISTGLPIIRPMPSGGVNSALTGLPSMSAVGHFAQDEEAPTHVVGSQGRRGILPSAPGRPSAPTGGAPGATKSLIPQKDADGKYPCPHCNKTYLHAKHLKRHLLRHTGDRPYMCHLCKDTFSRSDILKRHFQKCSIRRGNPTGANHLAHQIRRNTNGSNRLSIGQSDGPIGLAGLAEVTGSSTFNLNNSPKIKDDGSTRSSRTNSLIGLGGLSHRGSVAGLGILGSNAPHSEQMVTSTSYQPGMSAYSNASQLQSGYAFNPQMNTGNIYGNQVQQMSFLGQTSSRYNNGHHSSPHLQNGNDDGHDQHHMDWSRGLAEGGQDGFADGQPANTSSGMHIKSESEAKQSYRDSFLGDSYSHPGVYGHEFVDREHAGSVPPSQLLTA